MGKQRVWTVPPALSLGILVLPALLLHDITKFSDHLKSPTPLSTAPTAGASCKPGWLGLLVIMLLSLLPNTLPALGGPWQEHKQAQGQDWRVNIWVWQENPLPPLPWFSCL